MNSFTIHLANGNTAVLKGHHISTHTNGCLAICPSEDSNDSTALFAPGRWEMVVPSETHIEPQVNGLREALQQIATLATRGISRTDDQIADIADIADIAERALL